MPIGVSYMGTKRQLAQYVAATSAVTDEGPFLDLFAGICAASQALGGSRPVWCNDAQTFSYSVASAFFCSKNAPLTSIDLAPRISAHYFKNFDALREKFSPLLDAELRALEQKSVSRLKTAQTQYQYFETDRHTKKIRSALSVRPKTFPYRLFSFTYAGTYLALHQCIEVDSLRYALDSACEENAIDDNDHLWACLALCEAVAKCSPTTGHFAQYLMPKEGSKNRYFLQRNKSIWREWLKALSSYTPIGSRAWRAKNRSYKGDALKLIERLKRNKSRPALIYADPPYTDDQYSRYYHLYETILHYDYPRTRSKARYRDERFNSDFSSKLRVEASFEKLIGGAAELGSGLIISYPSNGLLNEAEHKITSLLKLHFNKVRKPLKLSHRHSSLGASKGLEKHPVTEMLFWASQK